MYCSGMWMPVCTVSTTSSAGSTECLDRTCCWSSVHHHLQVQQCFMAYAKRSHLHCTGWWIECVLLSTEKRVTRVEGMCGKCLIVVLSALSMWCHLLGQPLSFFLFPSHFVSHIGSNRSLMVIVVVKKLVFSALDCMCAVFHRCLALPFVFVAWKVYQRNNKDILLTFLVLWS